MTTLLVSSGGGHLQQLAALLPRLGLTDDVVWATPKSGLSDDLLADHCHVELEYRAPRDWQGALRQTGSALVMLRHLDVDRIISTGASPAPPFFLSGAALGLELHYIESATRSAGPSLSGRLVAKVPSAHLYTQYEHWSDSRWLFAGSIFDPYTAEGVPDAGSDISRVVVTLGTEAFDFGRAVRKLMGVLPRKADVLWQTGHTDVTGLEIGARPSVPWDELRSAIAEADLVVSHAGTGSAVTCFELGKVPLLLPREAKHGEHVDDHQFLTATELARRGLAVQVPVDRLTPGHLAMPMSKRVVNDEVERPFHLVEGHSRRLPRAVDLHLPGGGATSGGTATSHSVRRLAAPWR